MADKDKNQKKEVLVPKTNNSETTNKEVLVPNKIIDVEKSTMKATDGNVIVQGKHSSVKVSPLTAKIISKFKK